MKNWFLFVAIIFVGTLAEAETMDRTFSLSLFETEQACIDSQKGSEMHYNCYRTIKLRADGTAMVVVTDIANSYNYTLENSILTLTSDGPSDAPNVMTLKLTVNRRNLVDSNSQVWEWRD